MDSLEPETGTWSWLKEWTGYAVTILPYVSSALVLVPRISLGWKFAILIIFAIFVVAVRVVHETAGVAVTSPKERENRPKIG